MKYGTMNNAPRLRTLSKLPPKIRIQIWGHLRWEPEQHVLEKYVIPPDLRCLTDRRCYSEAVEQARKLYVRWFTILSSSKTLHAEVLPELYKNRRLSICIHWDAVLILNLFYISIANHLLFRNISRSDFSLFEAIELHISMLDTKYEHIWIPLRSLINGIKDFTAMILNWQRSRKLGSKPSALKMSVIVHLFCDWWLNGDNLSRTLEGVFETIRPLAQIEVTGDGSIEIRKDEHAASSLSLTYEWPRGITEREFVLILKNSQKDQLYSTCY